MGGFLRSPLRRRIAPSSPCTTSDGRLIPSCTTGACVSCIAAFFPGRCGGPSLHRRLALHRRRPDAPGRRPRVEDRRRLSRSLTPCTCRRRRARPVRRPGPYFPGGRRRLAEEKHPPLIEAFTRWSEHGDRARRLPPVITGTSLDLEFRCRCRSAPEGSLARLCQEGRAAGLYAGAAAFLYPGIYEGFGLRSWRPWPARAGGDLHDRRRAGDAGGRGRAGGSVRRGRHRGRHRAGDRPGEALRLRALGRGGFACSIGAPPPPRPIDPTGPSNRSGRMRRDGRDAVGVEQEQHVVSRLARSRHSGCAHGEAGPRCARTPPARTADSGRTRASPRVAAPASPRHRARAGELT